MAEIGMTVTAWNNGTHAPSGAGSGLKVRREDRDAYFVRDWGTIKLHLPGDPKSIEVNIDKESFWSGTCRELIHKDIGHWFRTEGLAPWPKGNLPKFRLVKRGAGVFWLNK